MCGDNKCDSVRSNFPSTSLPCVFYSYFLSLKGQVAACSVYIKCIHIQVNEWHRTQTNTRWTQCWRYLVVEIVRVISSMTKLTYPLLTGYGEAMEIPQNTSLRLCVVYYFNRNASRVRIFGYVLLPLLGLSSLFHLIGLVLDRCWLDAVCSQKTQHTHTHRTQTQSVCAYLYDCTTGFLLVN